MCVCVCVCVGCVCVCVCVCVILLCVVEFTVCELRYVACMRCCKMLNKKQKDGVWTDHCPKCLRFKTEDTMYNEFIMEIMVSFGMVFFWGGEGGFYV